MKFEKIVSDEGTITITIDGKFLDYNLSKELTGTTGAGTIEAGAGIFTEKNHLESIRFGDFDCQFSFKSSWDPAWSVDSIAEILSDRIIQVRLWVDSCKRTGGVCEVQTPEQVVSRLAAEGKLLYRDSRGTFRKLEL